MSKSKEQREKEKAAKLEKGRIVRPPAPQDSNLQIRTMEELFDLQEQQYILFIQCQQNIQAIRQEVKRRKQQKGANEKENTDERKTTQ